ncbi:MAG: hypothetical protein D6746_07480 [Bacteroidetes bacterium]|nr:MAG: hypothetical protein D6746_07480 [Bacteroidota bacterium]
MSGREISARSGSGWYTAARALDMLHRIDDTLEEVADEQFAAAVDRLLNAGVAPIYCDYADPWVEVTVARFGFCSVFEWVHRPVPYTPRPLSWAHTDAQHGETPSPPTQS